LKQKFIDFYFEVAEQTSKLSHAIRLKVGAVIVKDNNIVSFGYNGTPSGWNNDCEEKIYTLTDHYDGIDDDGNSFQLRTKSEVIHAESNAIAKLARQNGNGQDATMFITHAPCVECAKLIIQAGIKKVYWKSEYRDTAGVELLNTAGITTWKE